MDEQESIDDVINRLEEGDEAAAAEIFGRFAGRLISVARQRLDARVRQKVDPEDVVQSVFRSFFRRQNDGQFEFAGWGSLWGLLVRMTQRKCNRRVDSLHAACRDLRREVRPGDLSDSTAGPWEVVVRQPTPQEAAGLEEILENLMSGLSPRDRQILTLRLQGYTVPEISQQVQRTERTVHRALAAVRENLQCVLEDDRDS